VQKKTVVRIMANSELVTFYCIETKPDINLNDLKVTVTKANKDRVHINFSHSSPKFQK
jgi:hypothetical protein